MKKLDALYVVLLLIGAFWAFIINSANKETAERITPCQLIEQAANADEYISTDELARRLMSDDPTLVLIDLRPKYEFDKFSLQGAINIPLENLLDKEYESIINQTVYTNVFYSNSSDLAAKAWIITKRKGYKNNYILRGGLNRWVETILRPKRPAETAKNSEFELYHFRKAASAYFGGGSATETPGSSTAAPVKAPIKRKKKEAAGGGCD